jgi:tripartite-type tricarboxylate transporter receptor subunit TctC
MKNLLVLALCVGALATARAQPYPSKPVTLVVPFAPGGPSDALARQIAQRLGTRLGQQVIVENVAGAGGTIGLAKVTKAQPDGYTLGFGTIGTHVANVAVYRKLPYDPISDFEPVGFVGSAPLVLIARTTLPAKNLKEFEAYAKANKGKLTYGSAGVGSISHFGCIMLLSALKLEIVHVPYKGVAPAMTDLMGGQIDFMCDQTTTALSQIQGGKVKAIAALSRSKIPVLPGLQTADAAGWGEVDVRSWNALFAPKGTPADVIKRLNDELVEVMQDRELRASMEKVGVDLPTRETLTPSLVTGAVQLGIRRDVPALKARAEYLD